MIYTTTLYLLFTALTSLVRMGAEQPVAIDKTYQNPVFEPILADPSVFRDPVSGDFFAYGTEDNWGDGQGARIVPVLRSSDLVDWKLEGPSFLTKPNWKPRGGIWAPNVNRIDGRYYMYYSFSTWGDPDPGIGLAIADRPEGPFIDQGALFTSEQIGVPNSIDPHYWEENGKKYLFWGSYNDGPQQGNYMVSLSKDGKSIVAQEKKVKVAAGDVEAVMIHKRGKYYYYFGSKENCCEGANSKYHVVVARSVNLKGPYLDKLGRDLAERGNGTLFISGNEHIAGPGHNSRIITDDEGTDWMMYHAIDRNQGKVSSGASRRMLMLDRVKWVEEWPEISGHEPSSTAQKAPVFK